MRNALITGGVVAGMVVLGVGFFLYTDSSILNASSSAISARPGVVVPFAELARGAQSSILTRTNYLITSASELEKLWKMIGAEGQPPSVDFTKDSVAAVFAGAQSVAGYTISVSEVEDSEVRMVTVTLAKPESACAPASSTTPYQIVSLPKTSLAFAHEDVVTVAPCAH